MALRLALFGQAAFGKDVAVRLLDAGHEIVGVYTPPVAKRPDPLAAEAETRGLPLFRHRRFRRKGEAIPERVDEFLALEADLAVLAFVTVILPHEIVDAPPRGALCFHPSLLPRFRGGNALAWQLILGEAESGVTVFQPDAGVDTGPIVIQKGGVKIEATDTAGTLYFQKLYGLGVDAMVEAADAIDRNTAEPRAQDESRATHQGLVTDEVARIDWSRGAVEVDRLIRGCDPQPGAHALHGSTPGRLFAGRLAGSESNQPPGTILDVGADGLVIAAKAGDLRVGRVRVGDAAKVAAAEAGLAAGERLE